MDLHLNSPLLLTLRPSFNLLTATIIPNLFKWAIAKYPTLTLGQLEKNMPALQREYGQEKAMRKVNQKHRPSVTPADIK